MTGPEEQLVHIDAIRVPPIRDTFGVLSPLGDSLCTEGMRHPVVLWKDGTLISGSRRHRASVLLGSPTIPAVFVDTIEDAAKRLLIDNEDDYLALPPKPTEVCRLWELLRRLDRPAATARAEAARRRGVELRRLTQAGKRPQGRAGHSEDYVLATLSGPSGFSLTTAKRLWAIYTMAYGPRATPPRSEQAREALVSIDAGETGIHANYTRLISGRGPAPRMADTPPPPETAPAARQITAWNRSLPQMEGLVAGLVELGPPNAALTWDQVSPVHARLMAVRRDIEKIIKKMRETNQS
jgi:hypothetical protein